MYSARCSSMYFRLSTTCWSWRRMSANWSTSTPSPFSSASICAWSSTFRCTAACSFFFSSAFTSAFCWSLLVFSSFFCLLYELCREAISFSRRAVRLSFCLSSVSISFPVSPSFFCSFSNSSSRHFFKRSSAASFSFWTISMRRGIWLYSASIVIFSIRSCFNLTPGLCSSSAMSVSSRCFRSAILLFCSSAFCSNNVFWAFSSSGVLTIFSILLTSILMPYMLSEGVDIWGLRAVL